MKVESEAVEEKSENQKQAEKLAKEAHDAEESVRLAKQLMEKMTRLRRTTAHVRTQIVYKKF